MSTIKCVPVVCICLAAAAAFCGSSGIARADDPAWVAEVVDAATGRFETKNSGAKEKKLPEALIESLRSCRMQRQNLQVAGAKFPELKADIGRAESLWDSAFKPAEANLEKRLTALQGEKPYSETLKTIEAALSEQRKRLEKQTLDEAKEAVGAVRRMALGQLDFPGRSLLIDSHPMYMEDPALEFQRGMTAEYSTASFRQPLGVEVKLKIPMSWKPVNFTEDSGVLVQMWASDGGFGNEVMLLMFEKGSASPSKEAVEAVFVEWRAKKLLLHKGSTFIKFTKEMLNDLPLGIFEASHEREVRREKSQLLAVEYFFIIKERFVRVAFGFTDPDESMRTSRREKLAPLMEEIVQSVEIK